MSREKYDLFFVSGSNYYVRILSTIDRELLKAGASVALHKHSNALVDILPPESDSSISMLQPGKRGFFFKLVL
jgi:26S proteasome regulatory subunit T3